MTLVTPLPSLLRAYAQDAANAQMRAACRKIWSEDDYNLACSTQERLIRACYGRPADNQDHLCFIRFSVAEGMQKVGTFHLKSKFDRVLQEIDQRIGA